MAETPGQEAQQPSEQRVDARRADLILSPDQGSEGIDFTRRLLDLLFGAEDAFTAAEGLRAVSREMPESLSTRDRLAVRAGGAASLGLPWAVLPLARRWLRDRISHLVLVTRLPNDPAAVRKRASGFGSPYAGLTQALAGHRETNTNAYLALLGSAVHGPAGAAAEVQRLVATMLMPGATHVVVDPARIVADGTDWSETDDVAAAAQAMQPLFDACLETGVSLSVEAASYRWALRVPDILVRALADARFDEVRVGVRLPAEMPESRGVAERLIRMARDRVDHGGAAIEVTVGVAGLIGAERISSIQTGLAVPVLDSPAEIYAQTLRLVRLLASAHSSGVRVVLASEQPSLIAAAREIVAGAGAGGAAPNGVGVIADVEFAVRLRAGLAPALAAQLAADGVETRVLLPVCPPDELSGAADLLVGLAAESAIEVPSEVSIHASLAEGAAATQDATGEGSTVDALNKGTSLAATPFAPAQRTQLRSREWHPSERDSALFYRPPHAPAGFDTGGLTAAVLGLGHNETGELQLEDYAPALAIPVVSASGFANEPATDATLASNREWAASLLHSAAHEVAQLDSAGLADQASAIVGEVRADADAEGALNVADPYATTELPRLEIEGLEELMAAERSGAESAGAETNAASIFATESIETNENGSGAFDSGAFEGGAVEGSGTVEGSGLEGSDLASGAVVSSAAENSSDRDDSDVANAASDEDADTIVVLKPGEVLPIHPLSATLTDARATLDRWTAQPPRTRALRLRRAALGAAAARDRLTQALARDTGAPMPDIDQQVSDIVDAARYSGQLAEGLAAVRGAEFLPGGLAVVIASSTVTLAEQNERVLAALAAGCAVLWAAPAHLRHSCRVLVEEWEAAGLTAGVVKLIEIGDSGAPDADSALPLTLIAQGVDRATVLGDQSVARRLQRSRPDLRVEGQFISCGAMIVTPSADSDAAIRDLVASAFTGSGFRSVRAAILVGRIARSTGFTSGLADAVRALRVGDSVRPDGRDPLSFEVGPLPEPPSAAGLRALTELGRGESWLVQPEQLDDAGRLWSPGVRIGVPASSPFWEDARAVPVLGLIRARSFTEALRLQQRVGGGSVAALQSLDRSEIAPWLAGASAASLVLNRATTGARIERHPGGSWGPDAQASPVLSGGPNQLVTLGAWQVREGTRSSTLHLRGLAPEVQILIEAAQSVLEYERFDEVRRAALSDALAWHTRFGLMEDAIGLGIERNVLRYWPVATQLRLAEGGSLAQLLRVLAAALLVRAPITVSTGEVLPGEVTAFLASQSIKVSLERDEDWLERVSLAGHASGAGSGAGGAGLLTGTTSGGSSSGVGAAGSPGSSSGAVGLEHVSRVRLIGGDRVRVAEWMSGQPHLALWAEPVTMAGPVELLSLLREQSISASAHRHGIAVGVPELDELCEG